MFNKTKILLLSVLFFCGLSIIFINYQVCGSTMLVIPDRVNVVQLAFDIASEYSTEIVAYQRASNNIENPVLYHWDGVKWVNISLDDYISMDFLPEYPSDVVFIGEDNIFPSILFNRINHHRFYDDHIFRIHTCDRNELINSFGNIYHFDRSHWRGYARRYNMELKNINNIERRPSWYDGSISHRTSEDGRRRVIHTPSHRGEPSRMGPSPHGGGSHGGHSRGR